MFSNSLNIELICMLQLINYYYYDSLLSPLFTYRCFILSRHSWSALNGPGVANNIIQTELTTQRTADWLRSWGGDGVTQHLLLTLSAVHNRVVISEPNNEKAKIRLIRKIIISITTIQQ